MTIDPTTLGYISMRNEDGTQWYCLIRDCGQPFETWSDYSERTTFPYSKFLELEAKTLESRKRDCPDNGFFGIYNLKFTEVDK